MGSSGGGGGGRGGGSGKALSMQCGCGEPKSWLGVVIKHKVMVVAREGVAFGKCAFGGSEQASVDVEGRGSVAQCGV